MADSYLTTKTWTRAEWNEAQTKGTEGGFVAWAQIKTPYEEYLKNAGFKSEADAMAKRAEEDAAGGKFGEVQSDATKAFLAERKDKPEYLAELDAARAKARTEEAKRIALLSKGYITGQEAVYIPGTPENLDFLKNKAERTSTGVPIAPNAYLDAQAFAARWDEYHRYGATSPTSTTWDDAKKQYVTNPNPFFNAQVLVPTPGMGTRWDALERAKWATVGAGGRTAATEQAEYNLLNFFSGTVGWQGNPLPAGYRFFMRTPGDITMPTGTPVTPKKTRVSSVPDANGNFVINYSDGSKQVTDKNGVITTTSSDGTIIPNDTEVDGFGNAAGWMLGDGTGGDGTGGGGTGGVGGTSGTGGTTTSSGKATTNLDVLKASLRGLGFTSGIINASAAFLSSLLRDGLDADNATEIFLNSKEYTLKNGKQMTSPFYTEYGYLNEGLTVPKDAATIFNTVEGFKGVVDKYKLSSKYMTPDSLKLYFKNDVTVADLSERAGAAQLRAVESDPFQVDSLMKLGYIGSPADLTDFYLDNKIGKEQLELNRQTGVFTAEALRRAKSGISTSADQIKGFKQLTATLAAKGYNEAQISQLAGTGFENIAQTLQPTTQLAQIYEKAGGTVQSNTALTENIQSNLLQEEFMGTASERRKRLSEQNIRAFQGQAGTTTGSLRTSSTAGML